MLVNEVIILCGGLGTRFQGVSTEIPKVLAPIEENVTFLDILFHRLQEVGITRYILCVGHLSEQIITFVKERYNKLEVVFSIESNPLGTGGAVKQALLLAKGSNIIVLNGDSLCSVNLLQLVDSHVQHNALVTLTTVEIENTVDYGSIVAKADKIIEFKEKQPGKGLINAGIYVISKAITKYFPTVDKFSLENLFTELVKTNNVYCYKTDSTMLDIGTPERYKLVKHILEYSFI